MPAGRKHHGRARSMAPGDPVPAAMEGAGVMDAGDGVDVPELSVVIPVRDEEASIPRLAREVESALDGAGIIWECLWVDDGSRDGSRAALEAVSERRAEHRFLRLSPAAGQSGALLTGFRAARGELIATLDGDLQNDPGDLPGMVEQLRRRDVDLVNGVRVRRRDGWLRRISSHVANGFRNLVTHEQVTDVGCAIRVFRSHGVSGLPAFRGMHRFLPTLLRLRGYSVAELPVSHRSRQVGRTHYGVHNRLWVGLLDTLGVWWLQRRWVEPVVAESSKPEEARWRPAPVGAGRVPVAGGAP
ncbi:MAG TPA: glycosyltransferase family 2 protein [Longimicrobiales bacterium]|nr:glycosyltransferase family 2 protein [Longimicrobiales bacterium]